MGLIGRLKLIHADLHLHTYLSPDSKTSFTELIETCQKCNISCIAVTDHNAFEGAFELSRIAPFKVIPSEEIKTISGEIIGFFLKERIPRGLSAKETAIAIKEQGGLVCIPHPFDRVRGSRLNREALEEIVPYLDIIEGFNARTTLLRDSEAAVAFARKHGLAMSAGSDAHNIREIGRTYVEMPPFETKEEFLESLRAGRIVGVRANPLVHFYSVWAKLRKKDPHKN